MHRSRATYHVVQNCGAEKLWRFSDFKVLVRKNNQIKIKSKLIFHQIFNACIMAEGKFWQIIFC